jgi:small-conductance mechanosensitive channel
MQAPHAPEGLIHRLLDWVTHSGPLGPLFATLVVLALVLFVSGLLWWIAGGPVMRRLAQLLSAPVESLRPLRAGVRVAIVLGAASTLLSYFTEVDLFTLLAGGLALIATGFVALWSTLSNILCTIVILVTRPFRIGDMLSFPPDNISGQVVDLSFFFTTLRTPDGGYVNVPNTIFFQRIVVRKETSTSLDLGTQLGSKQPVPIPPPPEKEAPAAAPTAG